MMFSKLKLISLTVLKKVLSRFGLHVFREEVVSAIKKQHVNALNICVSLAGRDASINHDVLGVVFSKDRPMQLDALLKSYLINVRNPSPLRVLYSATTDRYSLAYNKVLKRYSNEDIEFRLETDFKRDLLAALDGIQARGVFFLVDDMMFIRQFDMHEFASVDLSIFIPSMRLGCNLKKCYTAMSKQKLPSFIDNNPENSDTRRLKWLWKDGEYDWGYPLSVDGNLFSFNEMFAMVSINDFRAPNSFEASLQWYAGGFENRYGICFESSVVVNIPFNKVQSENGNISGNISSDFLLDKWLSGFEIDVQKYSGLLPESAHMEMPLFLIESDQ